MKTIKEEIEFQLTQHGWYFGDTQVCFEEIPETFEGTPVVVEHLSDGGLAEIRNGIIRISPALKRFASYPQIIWHIAHEQAHKILGPKNRTMHPHDKEFFCDAWALLYMIKSGGFLKCELYDAIATFGELINDAESLTHPASKKRYKRLKRLLEEYV